MAVVMDGSWQGLVWGWQKRQCEKARGRRAKRGKGEKGE